MRIRSIKPEFWRSDDVDALSVFERLLFIGLWSYVDDNGVGVYSVKDIAAELFAGDLVRDSRETVARVSEGLQTLSEHNLISLYSAEYKDSQRNFICINSWSKHQRIDKPGKARYPRHSNDSQPMLDISVNEINTDSRDPRESPATGTGEQRNRGTDIKPPVVPLEGDTTATGKTQPSKRRTSKTLIPDDWHPNEHHMQTAGERGIDLATEVEKFKAYADSHAKRYANWDQAFNNWLLNASNFNKPQQQGYRNKAQERYEQNMQRARNAQITRQAQQPQLTGRKTDNDFGF